MQRVRGKANTRRSAVPSRRGYQRAAGNGLQPADCSGSGSLASAAANAARARHSHQTGGLCGDTTHVDRHVTKLGVNPQTQGKLVLAAIDDLAPMDRDIFVPVRPEQRGPQLQEGAELLFPFARSRPERRCRRLGERRSLLHPQTLCGIPPARSSTRGEAARQGEASPGNPLFKERLGDEPAGSGMQRPHHRQRSTDGK